MPVRPLAVLVFLTALVHAHAAVVGGGEAGWREPVKGAEQLAGSRRVDCQGSWSSCGSDCHHRFHITRKAQHGGKQCSYPDGYKRTCTGGRCQGPSRCSSPWCVDCQGEWSSCGSDCQQTFHVTRKAKGSGKQCATSDGQKRACTGGYCLSNETLANFRSFGFGMVSYYDTMDSNAQDALIHFMRTYNIKFLNQYVCAFTRASDFATFVNRVRNEANASVNLLFDNTVVAKSTGSTCDIECKKGASKGRPGWCCGSVARKFNWTAEVLMGLDNVTSLTGAAFDIEGLSEQDFMTLFATMRIHWDASITPFGGSQMLRWYFGSQLGPLAVEAISKGLIDQAYYENYQNSISTYVSRAERILAPMAAMFSNSSVPYVPEGGNGAPVALLSEFNCCVEPCSSVTTCGKCHTQPLPYHETISFCGYSVDKVLETISSGVAELHKAGYKDLLSAPVLYDYRALSFLLTGQDATGAKLCTA